VRYYREFCIASSFTFLPVYRWTANGTFAQYIMAPKNAWGMALLIAMDVLYLFSTPFWRKHAYNVFIWSHTLSVLVIIPAVSPSLPLRDTRTHTRSCLNTAIPRYTCTSRHYGFMP
jgi:hypothetical protein